MTTHEWRNIEMIKTISVVTVTYNSERYLDETIQSVVTQRGDFYVEYIVIDNCSTDNTLEILKRCDKEILSENFRCNCRGVSFKYLSEPDNGMYDALSKGIQLCNGEISAYINSDDFYLPNAFSTTLIFFNDPEVEWLSGLPSQYNEVGAIIATNSPCVYRSKFIEKGVYGKHLPHIQQEGTFWRNALSSELDFEKLSRFKFAGDSYMWIVFSKKHKLHTVKSQLSGFRLHSKNKSLDMKEYNEEFVSIPTLPINALDFVRIYVYKILYFVLGNRLLIFFPSIKNLHNHK